MMKETTTMTNPKSVKERNTKIISTGLAVATGIGIVGVIGFRTAVDASAQNSSEVENVDAIIAEVPTLDGYSAQQLQAYAEALKQEAVRLSDYRNQLNKVAKQLANQSGGKVTVSSKPTKSSQPAESSQPAVSSQPAESSKATAAPKVAPVPAAPKVAPVPAIQKPAPQTNSQGSG